jgi:hypothetical protein
MPTAPTKVEMAGLIVFRYLSSIDNPPFRRTPINKPFYFIHLQ